MAPFFGIWEASSSSRLTLPVTDKGLPDISVLSASSEAVFLLEEEIDATALYGITAANGFAV